MKAEVPCDKLKLFINQMCRLSLLFSYTHIHSFCNPSDLLSLNCYIKCCSGAFIWYFWIHYTDLFKRGRVGYKLSRPYNLTRLNKCINLFISQLKQIITSSRLSVEDFLGHPRTYHASALMTGTPMCALNVSAPPGAKKSVFERMNSTATPQKH